MKQYAFITENGLIQRTASPGQDDMYIAGEYYDGAFCIEIPVDVDLEEFHKTKYYKNGEWKTRSEKPNEYSFWNLETENWEVDSERLYAELRAVRDGKLFQSDWTQIPDAPLTAEQKAAWATYRQELRDVPANNTNITDLSQVTWPTEPQ